MTRQTESIRLSNGKVQLATATSFGPRLTSFSLIGGENVLAVLGDLGIDLPDGRSYSLRGGHRLWAAPERPEVTYEPDDAAVSIVETHCGVEVTQQASDAVGLEKMLGICLQDRTVELTHVLTNRGDRPIEVAPWAITQLAPGGTAIIPLRRELADPHGHQPNANITVWPYSGVDDSPFVMHDRLLLVNGDRTTPTKVGTALDRGWLAYLHAGVVFVKRAFHDPSGNYTDLGASGQCYCNSDFVELETVGQLATLHPQESVTHLETWELHRVNDSTSPQDIPELLNLDRRSTA